MKNVCYDTEEAQHRKIPAQDLVHVSGFPLLAQSQPYDTSIG